VEAQEAPEMAVKIGCSTPTRWHEAQIRHEAETYGTTIYIENSPPSPSLLASKGAGEEGGMSQGRSGDSQGDRNESDGGGK
jgi:hypothetical protein